MSSSFAPSPGVAVEYDGHVGEIRFVCDQYLTLCIRTKDSDMIGDCCLVIYKRQWDDINILKSSHS